MTGRPDLYVAAGVTADQPQLLRALLVRRPRQAGQPTSRVFQEALALLYESVEVGNAAWSTLRTHEEKLYRQSEYTPDTPPAAAPAGRPMQPARAPV